MSLNAPIHMAKTRKRYTHITWCGVDSSLLNETWSNRRDIQHDAKSIYSWRTATCIHCLEAFKAESEKNLTTLTSRIADIISEFPKPQAVEAQP